ncbi:MAG: DUF1028 domain-containing protein [Methanobacteriota archaeon]|nr:MAG: DUF1028 domain-containing protein [Euryarchaeota archaeon]
MTFSIIALDKETGELGIAVQSKFPAVGSIVPWISLDGGAIATQALANIRYGTQGLKLLASGATARQTLDILLENDPLNSQRQVGIVDLKGNSVSFTGSDCYPWAGGKTAEAVAVQGNILVGEEVVEKMLDTFLKTDGDLAEKLMCALESGQKAGGDKRGQQSAHLKILKKGSGYDGSDIYVDVRVDDHPNATFELRRVFDLYSLTLLEREDPNDITKLTDDLYWKIGEKLYEIHFLERKPENIDEIIPAFIQWLHIQNYENKERNDGYVWNSILDFLFSL